MGGDLRVVVECGRYDYFSWWLSSASGGSCEAVDVACVGRVVGAVGAAASGSAASFSLAGSQPLFGAGVSGGDLVRVVHGHALDGGAVSRARLAERRDVSAPLGGVDTARLARAGDRGLAGAAGWCAQARLVAGARGRVAGRREKGGEQVARSLLGRPGSRYHLAVDANGLPLAVRLSAGNESERRQLLPLIDTLLQRGIRPSEVWADRGYDSRALEHALRERQIEPRISKRRRPGEPIPAGQASRTVWRGKKRHTKTRDPNARQRRPIERTNAWLKAKRRIATRRDRKADNYLAFLHLGMILILAKPL